VTENRLLDLHFLRFTEANILLENTHSSSAVMTSGVFRFRINLWNSGSF